MRTVAGGDPEYVAFAQSSGIRLTLNPNGVFGSLWAPSVVAQVRDMAADRQVQFGNHTWDHQDLTKLSSTEAARELTRNEQWIEDTFGSRPARTSVPPTGSTTPECSRWPVSSDTRAC